MAAGRKLELIWGAERLLSTHYCYDQSCTIEYKSSPDGGGVMFTRVLAALLACSAPLAIADHGAPNPLKDNQDKLSRSESSAFALAAARAGLSPHDRKRALGFDFEGQNPNSHFYTWMIVPSWGEGVDNLAVDRRTGDVWRLVSCKQIRSPELAALQAKFRRSFNVSASEVRMIEHQGFPSPDC